MIDQSDVTDHYEKQDLMSRVTEALHNAGLDKGTLDWSALVGLDQFHVRGLAATKELAAGLELNAGTRLIDVGCGLGGPARYLAATYGCRVTGIDLSPSFVDVARMLTERTGLADKISFRQADALDLPFADATFDCAWTQHVAMNISDRARFYGSIHRVLKPNGRLAIYDIVKGNAEPLIFPVPWARTAEISFLMTPDAMREELGKTGFSEISWADKTEAALAWFAEQRAASQSTGNSAALGLPTIMGSDFSSMLMNLARNFAAGRVRVVQAVVRRD